MPFTSDDQRKAAFANMRKRGTISGRANYGGHGGTTPRQPKPPKPPKPGTTPANPAYGTGAVGYAGNYLNGAPSWGGWTTNLPNTTQLSYGQQLSSWGPTNYTTEENPSEGYALAYLTPAERAAALAITAIVSGGATGIFGLAEEGASAASFFDLSTTMQASVLATQGSALGSAVNQVFAPEIGLNNQPRTTQDAYGYQTHYPDLVGRIASEIRKRKKKKR